MQQTTEARVELHHYTSGKAFYLAVCTPCLAGLNSGHHYRTLEDAQAECNRHNSTHHTH